MAVAHASLTGAELHEPKGVASALAGTVYVANGAGSGAWSSVGTSSFTGAISAFVTPLVPDGWLECDGTDINTTTYAALYAAMTIQGNGTRTNGSAVISGLTSTTHMRAGYFVFGTGFSAGTTILTIDSATQITVSANASSSGTATVIVSPWRVGSGIIRLPLMNTSGEFLRSRTSGQHIGSTQTDATASHTHTFSATSGIESVNHTHAVSGTTNNPNVDHTHIATNFVGAVNGGGSFLALVGSDLGQGTTGTVTNGASANHTHTFSTTSNSQSAFHTHSVSGTTGSTGASETRPRNIVVMYCVKT